MSNQKKKHDLYQADNASLLSLLRASLKGTGIGLALSAILAVIICASILGLKNPGALVFPLSLGALYLSSFIAGLIATRANGGSALVCGLISGGSFMLSYMLISLFFSAELSARYGFWISLLFHALIIVFSVLGGYVATSGGVKRNSHKRQLARKHPHQKGQKRISRHL